MTFDAQSSGNENPGFSPEAIDRLTTDYVWQFNLVVDPDDPDYIPKTPDTLGSLKEKYTPSENDGLPVLASAAYDPDTDTYGIIRGRIGIWVSKAAKERAGE